jgi:hypothetical protein
MKILMLSILPVIIIACNVPVEESAEAIATPFLGTAALCDPYIECNSTQDCITTSVPYAGTCWTPICYNPGVAGAGCGWDTLSGGQACQKPNGQNGTCASGMDEGDCI